MPKNSRRDCATTINANGSNPFHNNSRGIALEQFYEKLKTREFARASHWVRLYYAQNQGETVVCEVLIDNDAQIELQRETASFAWPAADEFYSVRLFLTLQPQLQNPSTAEGAVSLLFDLVAAHPEITEDEILQAMHSAGVPAGIAERAYRFTQIAWGRGLLEGLGIRFSSEYICFDSEGEISERGFLEQEPYFAAGSKIESRYVTTPAFKQIALSSAEANAVNKALFAGSKPEHLAMGPAFLFSEETSPEGREKARKTMDQEMRLIQLSADSQNTEKESKPAKPWWRLWN